MSLFSSLNTGISGLKASELGLATSGHNISNANNEYYTRQRTVTQASTPFHSQPGDIGTGVNVTTIVRIHDEFVYSRLKDSSNTLSFDSFNKNTLEEVSKYFPDLEGVGLGSDIENYFSSWNDLASNPEDGSQKIALVQNATTLASNLQDTRNNIRDLQDSINGQIKTNFDEINSIGEEIVELNIAINRVEVIEPNRANDLRDQRDHLEITLSNLLNVSVFKGSMTTENIIDANLTDQGTAYNMNIAGYSFVDGTNFHPLKISNSGNESAYYSIYSESQDGTTYDITDKIIGGKVGAMLDLRGRTMDSETNSGYPSDGVLQGYVDDLDAFAKTFITQTNNIYARSAQVGMQSKPNDDLKDDITLTNYSDNINTGSFDVVMYDAQGNEVGRKSIDINVTTTMNDGSAESIIGQLNEDSDDNSDNNSLNDISDYFTASYNYSDTSKSGVLQLSQSDTLSGYTIAIEDNGTNFAGTIGLSSFLSGDSAANISVESKYKKDPSMMNSYGAPISGNNDVANDMVQMQYDSFNFYGSNNSPVVESIEGFYRTITTQIATDGESAGRRYETSSTLFNTINAEFQSISGVNIDEELTDLMKFQTAYSANAKVITTISTMLDTLLGIKQ